MGKLLIKKNDDDIYRLEINDDGDYIDFDLTDMGLASRMIKASQNIVDICRNYVSEVTELSQKYPEESDELSQEIVDLEIRTADAMEVAYDSWMGKGTCKKIFGDKKSYQQYVDLAEALQEHYDKMHIQVAKAKKKLANKYLKIKEEIL